MVVDKVVCDRWWLTKMGGGGGGGRGGGGIQNQKQNPTKRCGEKIAGILSKPSVFTRCSSLLSHF
jgi:hypothetical protein